MFCGSILYYSSLMAGFLFPVDCNHHPYYLVCSRVVDHQYFFNNHCLLQAKSSKPETLNASTVRGCRPTKTPSRRESWSFSSRWNFPIHYLQKPQKCWPKSFQNGKNVSNRNSNTLWWTTQSNYTVSFVKEIGCQSCPKLYRPEMDRSPKCNLSIG